jgi:hypothetical protein
LSDEEFNSWQKKLVAAMIIALIGGGGVLLNKTRTDARHDPFTGTEGKLQERRLDTLYSIQQTMLFRMERREEEADACRMQLDDHLRQHP